MPGKKTILILYQTRCAQLKKHEEDIKTPDNENFRVAMVSESIHKLMYNVPQGPNFPHLPKTVIS